MSEKERRIDCILQPRLESESRLSHDFDSTFTRFMPTHSHKLVLARPHPHTYSGIGEFYMDIDRIDYILILIHETPT